MRAVRDHQILRRHADTLLAQACDFTRERHGINDHAIADDTHFSRPQNATRDQMQHIFFPGDDDGVPRVVATLRADDEVRLLGEEINDFAFAFVAPLGADQDRVGHVFGVCSLRFKPKDSPWGRGE